VTLNAFGYGLVGVHTAFVHGAYIGYDILAELAVVTCRCAIL